MKPKSPSHRGSNKSSKKNKNTLTAGSSPHLDPRPKDHTAMKDEETKPDLDPEPSLSKLLASLAQGARAVNNLPLSLKKIDDEDDDDATNRDVDEEHDGDGDGDDDDDEDEFSFRMSLPEFASLNHQARRSLSELLSLALNDTKDLLSLDDSGDGRNRTSDDDDDDDRRQWTNYEFDDPLLWEKCADACDALLDRVASYISSCRQDGSANDANDAVLGALGRVSDVTRAKSRNTYAQMLSSVADMEKPQNVYQGFVTHPPQNSRGEPFVPLIWEEGKRREMEEGGKWRADGHGLDTRFGETGGVGENDYNEYRDGEDVGRRSYAPDMVVPDFHYEHPYREEIESLEYRPWQLEVRDVPLGGDTLKQRNTNDGMDDDEEKQGIWIGNEEDLEMLCNHITNGQIEGEIHEIALDLEAHSHRTFAGFVCLMQLSLRRGVELPTFTINDPGRNQTTNKKGHNFLIDTLSLRHVIPIHLGPILSNPSILKVMHGADSDVPWLQRDFGCYIVNLFDTGRAARALKFPSAGLAYLLRKYAGVEADKVHQLSDWRRRPLGVEMRKYAVEDTMYLLDIYDVLRKELLEHPSKEVSIERVLDRSKKVCLIRYEKEPFRPSGYLGIMDGNARRRKVQRGKHEVTSELSPQQEAALKALYDWRDLTARQEDESVQYVCSNVALLRIASNRPATVSALQRLVNPLPPLVMRRSQEILDAIKLTAEKKSSKGSRNDGKPVEGGHATTHSNASASAHPQAKNLHNREMLSPILGSEDLYKQAGWMTPTSVAGKGSATSAAASSESEGEETFNQSLLDVDSCNVGYKSSKYSSHGIEMSRSSLEADGTASCRRGASTDGLGTARTALCDNGDGKDVISNDVMIAQKSANLIKREMIKTLVGETKDGKYGNGFSLIDLIRPLSEPEDFGLEDNEDNDGTKNDASTPNEEDDEADVENDEIAIPKSMREIYKLSNANRRRTNKEKTQKPVQFKDEEINDDVTKMKGDDIKEAEAVIASRGGVGGYFESTKRQRTGKLPPGRDGDIELMTKMGWVKDKQDAESLAVVASNNNDDNNDTERESNRKKSINKDGRGGKRGTTDYYSNLGAIGAFDPNTVASSNPFFTGVAAGAASMLSSDQKHSKPLKKNKKR
ncbi:hypothetical protein ACHAXS_006764 [Conticribra weissflogii]